MNGFLDAMVSLIERGFDMVNSIQGMIIALICAMLMRVYPQILVFAATATIAHELVNIGRRYLAASPHPIPNFFDMDLLQLIGIRFVGYVALISIFFLIRSVFLRK